MSKEWARVRVVCNVCGGEGVYHGAVDPGSPCPNCEGDGYTDTKMTVDISSLHTSLDKIWDKVK